MGFGLSSFDERIEQKDGTMEFVFAHGNYPIFLATSAAFLRNAFA